jgi:hypothetical protein
MCQKLTKISINMLFGLGIISLGHCISCFVEFFHNNWCHNNLVHCLNELHRHWGQSLFPIWLLLLNLSLYCIDFQRWNKLFTNPCESSMCPSCFLKLVLVLCLLTILSFIILKNFLEHQLHLSIHLKLYKCFPF